MITISGNFIPSFSSQSLYQLLKLTFKTEWITFKLSKGFLLKTRLKNQHAFIMFVLIKNIISGYFMKYLALVMHTAVILNILSECTPDSIIVVFWKTLSTSTWPWTTHRLHSAFIISTTYSCILSTSSSSSICCLFLTINLKKPVVNYISMFFQMKHNFNFCHISRQTRNMNDFCWSTTVPVVLCQIVFKMI